MHDFGMASAFSRARVLITAMTLISTLSACPSQELAALRPCTHAVGRAAIAQSGPSKVDFLLLVDDSPSMEEEQKKLADELPRLLNALTTGQIDDDGIQDFRPVDLHLGIITPNMGAPLIGVKQDDNASCLHPERGVLRVASAECGAAVDVNTRFLTAAPGADNTAFLNQASCMVKVGAKGCGFEAQLDAALKALSKKDANLSFSYGGSGEGDSANAGFLRDDALLVILLITDEDDCSVRDPSFFTFTGSEGSRPNMRCEDKAELLQPVKRYLDGFRQLKPLHPELVLFTTITGVPPEAVRDPEAVDYTALLASDAMRVREDSFAKDGPAPAPACRIVVPGGEVNGRDTNDQTAAPARRITELTAMFGEQGLVQSICQDDFRAALTALTKRISKVLRAACLPRKLNPNADGLVECNVLETLPPGSQCNAARGRSPLRVEKGGEVVCSVAQLAVVDGVTSKGQGWYYDSAQAAEGCAEGSGQVRFSEGAEPEERGRVDLECLQPSATVPVEARDWDAIGLPCSASEGEKDSCATVASKSSKAPRLFCEATSRTCQAQCRTDADCKDPMVCDRSVSPAHCVNPTCP